MGVDGAGQALVPVAGLGSTTAAGLARRISVEQWAAVETGMATVTARMLAWLPAARREALLTSVTIDLGTTDVEVYGHCCVDGKWAGLTAVAPD